MKSQFTKKRVSVILIALFALSFFSSCQLIDFEGGGYGSTPDTATKNKLDLILKEFTRTEEVKDGEAHRDLFLSSFSQVNFVLKNYGFPMLIPFSRDQWIGYFTSWDYDYYPVYGNDKYYIERGVAINQHDFRGYKNEQEDIYGTDLFMFVDTQDGWKILSLSATVVNPDDSTDYSSLSVNSLPDSAFMAFEKGINEKDSAAYESAFTSTNVPCFRIREKLKEAYSDDLHSASAFYGSIPDNVSNLKIKLEDVNIDIHDQLTAVASSEYSITKDGIKVEKGKMLATMVATPDMGWKISSMVFSISMQAKSIK